MKQRWSKMPNGTRSSPARRHATYRNDDGALEIRIGAREFECIGLAPPDDHPHVYLNMGERMNILCPYCATAYRFDPKLGRREADPASSAYVGAPMRGMPEAGRRPLEAVG
jgi:uncharacterized Zn-finger protein